jgi:hypothetical protein
MDAVRGQMCSHDLEAPAWYAQCAEQNGYSIIRITQEDVYSDTFDWCKMLKESIETIIQKKSVENHYISYDMGWRLLH